MQKFLKSDLFVILILFIIFIALVPFFYMHQGIFSIDIGRELYISQQVMQGDVLYKDIFNIYGPFSYQINGLLLFIFGDKVNTLYNFGLLNSFVIILFLYLISREFIRKSYAFLFSMVSVFSLVFTTFLFNSNITYSYGLIYGLSSFLVSLFFLLKYIKTGKLNFIYIASFFAGICIINKYEFIIYPFILAYVIYGLKPLSVFNRIKALLLFILAPLISFSVLFIQGLKISELVHAVNLMSIMAGSETMHTFYSFHGNFFNPQLYLKLFIKNPFLSVLAFIPFINIILFFVFLKKIKQDIALYILCLACILVSYKFILYLNMEHMGLFFFPICFLMLFVLCENIKNIDNLKYILLVCLILFFAYSDFNSLKEKTNLLETSKGDFYMYYKDKLMMQTAIDYVLNNTQENEKVVVVPEGAFVNYITNRKSDSQLHNLVPLYYKDTFGEDNVVRHFEEKPADYYIILPLPTSEYGSPNFCAYAEKLCKMMENKYKLEKDEHNIKIYKRG